jgi:hypothetical protein
MQSHYLGLLTELFFLATFLCYMLASIRFGFVKSRAVNLPTFLARGMLIVKTATEYKLPNACSLFQEKHSKFCRMKERKHYAIPSLLVSEFTLLPRLEYSPFILPWVRFLWDTLVNFYEFRNSKRLYVYSQIYSSFLNIHFLAYFPYFEIID